jgi:hypothetical protein
MADDPNEKRKRRLEQIALAAFMLSLSAGGWALIALLADFMNPRLLSISFFSFVPPIALSFLMYVVCKYVEKRAEGIVTERQEEEERRRRDLAAAIAVGARPPTSMENPPDI